MSNKLNIYMTSDIHSTDKKPRPNQRKLFLSGEEMNNFIDSNQNKTVSKNDMAWVLENTKTLEERKNVKKLNGQF